MKLKGMIFDLDGTLGDTIPVIIEAFRSAFVDYLGRSYTDSEITMHFGPTEEGIMRKLVPGQWENCLQAYFDAYEKLHRRLPGPFPGIDKALGRLKQLGLCLAIVTGKCSHTTALSLKYFHLANYFDQVETGSKDGAVKPIMIRNVLDKWGVEARRVAYIGDSVYDIQAAKEAGVAALGAAWAATSDLNSQNGPAPSAIFHSVESFIEWIDTAIEPDER